MKRLALLFLLLASNAYGQAVVQGDPKTTEMTFTNAGSAGSPLTWTNGVTTARESIGLTATHYATLPAANSFPSGKVILYIDDVTVPVGGPPPVSYGRVFRPIVGNSLNGVNGVASPGTAADVAPFVAGGLNGVSTQRFSTDGATAWRSLDTGYNVGRLSDSIDKTKAATFNLAPNTTGNTRIVRVPDADSTFVRPALGVDDDTADEVNVGDEVVTGVNDDGTVELHTLASELPDPTGHEGDSVIVNQSGAYELGSGGGSLSNYVTLSDAADPIPWVATPGAARQNAVVTLSSATSRLNITGAESGMHFTLYVKQDATGGRALLPPTNSMTTGGTPGSIPSPTPVASQIDMIEGDYVGEATIPGFAFYQTASAMASPVPVGCGTAFTGLMTGAGTGTGVSISAHDQSARQYVSNQFVATSTDLICRVDMNIYKTGSPTYNMEVGIYEEASRFAVTDAVVTSGSNSVTSTTGGWVAGDVGQHITGTGIPTGTYIGTFVSPNSITLSSTKSSNTSVLATGAATGLPNANVTTYSGYPGALIGSMSSPIAASSIPAARTLAGGAPTGSPNADQNPTQFTGINMLALGGHAPVVGNTYFVVIHYLGAMDLSNYVNWIYSTASTTGYRIGRSTNGTSWLQLTNSQICRFTTYHSP